MATQKQVDMLITISSLRGMKIKDRKTLASLSNQQVQSLKVYIMQAKLESPVLTDPVDHRTREVPCSFCGAEAGELCWGVERKKVARKRRQTSHSQRSLAYKESMQVV